MERVAGSNRVGLEGWRSLATRARRELPAFPEVLPVRVPPAPQVRQLVVSMGAPGAYIVARALVGALEREHGRTAKEEDIARCRDAGELAEHLDALDIPPAEWAMFRAVSWRTAAERSRLPAPPAKWLVSLGALKTRAPTWYRDVAGAFCVGRVRYTPSAVAAMRVWTATFRAVSLLGASASAESVARCVREHAHTLPALCASAEAERVAQEAELRAKVGAGWFVW